MEGLPRSDHRLWTVLAVRVLDQGPNCSQRPREPKTSPEFFALIVDEECAVLYVCTDYHKLVLLLEDVKSTLERRTVMEWITILQIHYSLPTEGFNKRKLNGNANTVLHYHIYFIPKNVELLYSNPFVQMSEMSISADCEEK